MGPLKDASCKIWPADALSALFLYSVLIILLHFQSFEAKMMVACCDLKHLSPFQITQSQCETQNKHGRQGFTRVTVDVVAVIEVFVVERRAGRHQLLQPHLGDEEAAGQVEVLQRRKPTALRQSPATHTDTAASLKQGTATHTSEESDETKRTA